MRLVVDLVPWLVLCAGCFDFTGTGSGASVPLGSGSPDQSLTFAGAQLVFGAFPPNADHEHANIATGGTDVIALETVAGGPFTRLFEATVDEPAALAIAGVDGSSVTLIGGTGTAELDLTDPATGTLIDQNAYASSPLAAAAVVPTESIISSPNILTSTAAAFAFWPGDLEVGIALENVGGANRLVDTSLTLALGGATQVDWQTLSMPGATAGTYSIAVGSTEITARLAVVDHVDSLGVLIATNGLACFAADTGGAFVVGVPWSFSIDGAPAPSVGVSLENCVSAESGDHITANAGGLSLAVDVE